MEFEVKEKRAKTNVVSELKERKKGYVFESKFYFYGHTKSHYNRGVGVYDIVKNKKGVDVINKY